MLVKTGKRDWRARAESEDFDRDERLSNDEAQALRRKHLVKGLLTPVVAMPVGAAVGSAVGGGIGHVISNLKGLPNYGESFIDILANGAADTPRHKLVGRGAAIGGTLGAVVPAVLGIRHLLNYGASRKELEREKERNSVLDW